MKDNELSDNIIPSETQRIDSNRDLIKNIPNFFQAEENQKNPFENDKKTANSSPSYSLKYIWEAEHSKINEKLFNENVNQENKGKTDFDEEIIMAKMVSIKY